MTNQKHSVKPKGMSLFKPRTYPLMGGFPHPARTISNWEIFSAQKYQPDLERFRKPSHPDADLSEYRIGRANLFMKGLEEGLAIGNSIYSTGKGICPDSPYQFILQKGTLLLANLGFEVHESDSAILVTQIQGVTGRKDYLDPLKWSKLLLHVAQRFAFDSDFENVWVLPAERNGWEEVRSSETAKLIYDVTARREGFKYDEGKGVYVKPTIKFGTEEDLGVLERIGCVRCTGNDGIVAV